MNNRIDSIDSVSEQSISVLRSQRTMRWLANSLRRRLRGLSYGFIQVHDPYGQWAIGEPDNPGPAIQVKIHNPAFYWQLLISGSNGAAAAYQNGDWSCNDLTALLRLIIKNHRQMVALETGWARLGNGLSRLRHRLRHNSERNSRRNIYAHYDLSNEFFQCFLDPTMTYSAGIFDENPPACGVDPLEQASINKLDRICRKLELCPDHHILEIGTGWGSFAIHAARHYGCRVTTTTISREQFKLAEQRIREAGLQDRIELLLCDYRQLSSQYDKIVSIEMIEAVGHRYLPTYFQQCSRLLKADGQMLLQAITMSDQHHEEYLRSSDFIQQYIFPGGCLPSLSSLLAAIKKTTDCRISHIEDIGVHYAKTLRHWLNRFKAAESQVRALGYDSRFIRLWEYYLCYCEAGFEERYLGTLQLLLDKPDWRGQPVLAQIS